MCHTHTYNSINESLYLCKTWSSDSFPFDRIHTLCLHPCTILYHQQQKRDNNPKHKSWWFSIWRQTTSMVPLGFRDYTQKKIILTMVPLLLVLLDLQAQQTWLPKALSLLCDLPTSASLPCIQECVHTNCQSIPLHSRTLRNTKDHCNKNNIVVSYQPEVNKILGSGFPLLFFCIFFMTSFTHSLRNFQPHSNWLLFSDSSIADKSVIPEEKNQRPLLDEGLTEGCEDLYWQSCATLPRTLPATFEHNEDGPKNL